MVGTVATLCRRPRCRPFTLPGAHAECSEMLGMFPDKVGYIFYHNQDLELAAGGCTF